MNKTNTSPFRKKYILKLAVRCVILILCILMYTYKPGCLDILRGSAFFDKPSPLHLLWTLWTLDMIYQIFPINSHIPTGSRKLFKKSYVHSDTYAPALRAHKSTAAKAAYIILGLWIILISVLGVLYNNHILTDKELFLTAVVFYVCDLVCVLVWCPFRLIMKNRCCTTCRIFNWDHLMMFTPMIFINGFFSRSLIAVAVIVWIVWEYAAFRYPERFWEGSNTALRCSECTDKLCGKRCKK